MRRYLQAIVRGICEGLHKKKKENAYNMQRVNKNLSINLNITDK